MEYRVPVHPLSGDLWHRPQKPGLPQPFAVGKGVNPYGSDPGRNIHCLKLLAVSKSIGSDLLQPPGKSHFQKTGAAGKGIRPNDPDIIRDPDSRQIGPVREGFAADGGDRIGNGSLGYTGRNIEFRRLPGIAGNDRFLACNFPLEIIPDI